MGNSLDLDELYAELCARPHGGCGGGCIWFVGDRSLQGVQDAVEKALQLASLGFNVETKGYAALDDDYEFLVVLRGAGGLGEEELGEGPLYATQNHEVGGCDGEHGGRCDSSHRPIKCVVNWKETVREVRGDDLLVLFVSELGTEL